MKKLIIHFLLLITISFAAIQDIDQKYQPIQQKIGQYNLYPQHLDHVTILFKQLYKENRNDFTFANTEEMEFQIGKNQVVECLEDVAKNLSIGDAVSIVCLLGDDLFYFGIEMKKIIVSNTEKPYL